MKISLFQNNLQEFWYNLISSDTIKEVIDAGTKLIQILDNITSSISDMGAINIIVKPLSLIIDLIEQLTSGLGALNLPLAAVGITKLVKSIKGIEGGGRVKTI